MHPLFFHIGRLIVKHFADRLFLKEMEQNLMSYLEEQIQLLYKQMTLGSKSNMSTEICWTHYCEHYLMQYVHEGMHFRLADLLYKLEKYRMTDVEQDIDRYIFDFDKFYKKSIYAIWSEILTCLDMKEAGLARYLKKNTNLPKENESIRSVCNQLRQ